MYVKLNIRFFVINYISDEYNGYSLLDAVYNGDVSRMKKFLTYETIHFRHFKTGDSPLVSFEVNKNNKENNFLSSTLLVLHYPANIVVKLLKYLFDVVHLLIS
jgi:hypothetical protein